MTGDAPGGVLLCGVYGGSSPEETHWLPDSHAMRVSPPLVLALAYLAPLSRVNVLPASIGELPSLLGSGESGDVTLAILAIWVTVIWVKAVGMGISSSRFRWFRRLSKR